MIDHATRRADSYRRHADELVEAAQLDINRDQRRHMLDLAATYRRTADQMMSEPANPDQGLPDYWW